MLVLYVAGRSPNSQAALANLTALGQGPLAGRFALELVDVFADPGRALRDGVLVTPTLVKVSPQPPCRILGTLADRALVLRSLGLIPESGTP